MKKPKTSNPLCLECGLCCNGVIFADGQLQAGDDPARLRELGLRLPETRGSTAGFPKFRQPCAAFQDCRCQIYSDRPKYCRAFECSLLIRFQEDEIEAEPALKIIRRTRRQAGKVNKLLAQLGDTKETDALSTRFRRMQRRMEGAAVDETSADLFGELTLAMLDLQVMLGRDFYP
ncbi:MAG: YkgJ family cysteine cluster protein [Verrucomicrobiota bacterium]